jgi:hypothetical protein
MLEQILDQLGEDGLELLKSCSFCHGDLVIVEIDRTIDGFQLIKWRVF